MPVLVFVFLSAGVFFLGLGLFCFWFYILSLQFSRWRNDGDGDAGSQWSLILRGSFFSAVFFCFLALPWVSTFISSPLGSLGFLSVPWFVPFSSSSLSFFCSLVSFCILYVYSFLLSLSLVLFILLVLFSLPHMRPSSSFYKAREGCVFMPPEMWHVPWGIVGIMVYDLLVVFHVDPVFGMRIWWTVCVENDIDLTWNDYFQFGPWTFDI